MWVYLILKGFWSPKGRTESRATTTANCFSETFEWSRWLGSTRVANRWCRRAEASALQPCIGVWVESCDIGSLTRLNASATLHSRLKTSERTESTNVDSGTL